MKHAFLIMAHKNYDQLSMLIESLDSEDVDIFLHIDVKSPRFSPPELKKSHVFMIPLINITHGGYSQVACELSLLEHASKGSYDYYHLLTGQDILLKPVDEIKAFFKAHEDYNFIHYDTSGKSRDRYSRIKYYRVFQDSISGGRSVKSVFQNRIFIPLQKLFNVDRTRAYPDISFKSGSAYFSIKNDLACYILSQKHNIQKWFNNTISADEMFVQTLVFNSDFEKTLFDREYDDDCSGNQRFIDWKRGNPYIWRDKDYAELMESNLLFARKFDYEADRVIVDRLYCTVHGIRKYAE